MVDAQAVDAQGGGFAGGFNCRLNLRSRLARPLSGSSTWCRAAQAPSS
jgi:hypothetical protein